MAECRGMQAHDIELAHRATKDRASTAHQELPAFRLDAEAFEDRRKS